MKTERVNFSGKLVGRAQDKRGNTVSVVLTNTRIKGIKRSFANVTCTPVGAFHLIAQFYKGTITGTAELRQEGKELYLIRCSGVLPEEMTDLHLPEMASIAP